MRQKTGKKIEKKLQKRHAFLTDRKKRNAKNAFIEKFVFCEISCKTLISETDKVDIEKVQLYMPTIKRVMKKCGYAFDEDSLKMLFSGKTDIFIKRGTYSAKNLRDSIMHDMSVESMQEVFDRKKELHRLMDDYLNLFSSTSSKPKKRQRRKSKSLESDAVFMPVFCRRVIEGVFPDKILCRLKPEQEKEAQTWPGWFTASSHIERLST